MTRVLDGTWPRRAEKAPVSPRGDGRWLGPALLLSLALWAIIAVCVVLGLRLF
ncbi:MAG: hypothetical protein AB7I59_10690 [Geminicoccaceae bacterium]